MEKQKLLIATTNKGKLAEIESYLGDLPFQLLYLKDLPEEISAPEEDQGTTEGNAMLKAKYYAEKSGMITISDDSGIFIDALNGWPGVNSALIGNTNDERRAAVLEKMNPFENEEERTMSYQTVLVCYDPQEQSFFLARGKDCGILLKEPVPSTRDFTFDPIVFLPDIGKAYAEISIEEKNARSSRGKALQKMKYFLTKHYGARQIIAPVALILQDRKVLLQLRNDPMRPDFHKKWEFPGGGMEFGETIEENIQREVKEETGYDVEIIEQLNNIHISSVSGDKWKYQVFIIPHVCKIVGGEPNPRDAEVLELKWFDLDEASNAEMVGSNNELYKKILPKLKSRTT